MRKINLEKNAKSLFTTNIINTISLIHEYKGKQALYIESKKDSLTNLLNIAKIQSAEYSNKIEGIEINDSRIKELIDEKVAPKNRNEEEIAGYRDVLKLIHESYDDIFITPNIILQLHKILYKYSSSSFGGKYKTTDNITTFTSIGIIGIVVLSYIFEVFPMIINENKDINKTRTILSVIPPNVIYEIIRNQNSKENNVSLKN